MIRLMMGVKRYNTFNDVQVQRDDFFKHLKKMSPSKALSWFMFKQHNRKAFAMRIILTASYSQA